MSAAHRFVGRTAATTFGAGVLPFVSLSTAPADDAPPNCTTADMTGVMPGVSAAIVTDRFTHPEVNDFFTSLQGMPKTQARDETETYLDANPAVRAELEAIRQPGRDFRDRRNLPKTAMILADAI
jgi:hemophore-related protein